MTTFIEHPDGTVSWYESRSTASTASTEKPPTGAQPRPAGSQACRWCGAAIYWLVNRSTDKTAPIDALPAERGNLIVNLAERKYAIIPASQRAAYAGQLYVNHWATCRKAGQHGQDRKSGNVGKSGKSGKGRAT